MSTDSKVPYVPYGYAQDSVDGVAHTIGFDLEFPHPVDSVWAAVATPAGLRGWLAAADPFEPGPGGAVALRWLNGDDGRGDGAGDGTGFLAPGRITAWSRRRLAEYTLDARGSFGFTLRGVDDGYATRLRFRNDFTGDRTECVGFLAAWHHHFELLHEELCGRPTDWGSWTPSRVTELRAEYRARTD